MPGTLYLVPCVIAEGTQERVIPPQVKEELAHIRFFLAENVRTARRFLSSLKIYSSIESLMFEVLDKDTGEQDLPALFKPILEGHDVGILSESGCPGIADPGSLAVRYAHAQGIRVVPLTGPSSLLLALMASGLNGQNFAFHGYLPIEQKELARAIGQFEQASRTTGQTQIFIETPYRSAALLKSLAQHLKGETMLCVAVDLTGPGESIETKRASLWKNVTLEKLPAVFLFQA